MPSLFSGLIPVNRQKYAGDTDRARQERAYTRITQRPRNTHLTIAECLELV